MKQIFRIVLALTIMTSCHKSNFNREGSKLIRRNYDQSMSSNDCLEKIPYGHIFIELTNLDRDLILQKLKNFNDSIFGVPTDTMLYHTVGTPWSVSNTLILEDLFVNFQHNYYGFEIFPHKRGIEKHIMQHGMKNTYSEYHDWENISFRYALSACPKQQINSKYAEYGISVNRALLTQNEIDSIYSVDFKGTHPSTSTEWLRYGIDEYVADITISLEIKEKNDPNEYYYIPLQDTIRVYSLGPKEK